MTEGWISKGDYKTINNRSSVNYNIVNNDKNYSMAVLDSKIMDTKLANRKKCISEFEDLNHVFHPNFSNKYNTTLSEIPKVYSTCKGVFTNMYDSANRNGNIIKLFTKTNFKKDENKKENGSKNQNDRNRNNNNNNGKSNNNNNGVVNNSGAVNFSNAGVNRNKNNSESIANVMNHDNNSNNLIKNKSSRKILRSMTNSPNKKLN